MAFEITPELLDVIAYVESNNNPQAVNKRTGARGLFQFMPIAWQDVQENYPSLKDYGYEEYSFNPNVSRQFAEALLKLNVKRLGKDVNLDRLLASYNWGIGHVQKQGIESMPNETRSYIDKVNKYLKQGVPSNSHYKR